MNTNHFSIFLTIVSFVMLVISAVMLGSVDKVIKNNSALTTDLSNIKNSATLLLVVSLFTFLGSAGFLVYTNKDMLSSMNATRSNTYYF